MCRFLAKILVKDGAKDVPVGTLLAIVVRICIAKSNIPSLSWVIYGQREVEKRSRFSRRLSTANVFLVSFSVLTCPKRE